MLNLAVWEFYQIVSTLEGNQRLSVSGAQFVFKSQGIHYDVNSKFVLYDCCCLAHLGPWATLTFLSNLNKHKNDGYIHDTSSQRSHFGKELKLSNYSFSSEQCILHQISPGTNLIPHYSLVKPGVQTSAHHFDAAYR